MKAYTLFLFLLLSASISKAQFAPINATWHIGLPDGNGIGAESFFKYVNLKDTLINGDNYSLIKAFDHTNSILQEKNAFLSKDSNVVYYFLKGRKNKLFDLSVNLGDTVNLDLYHFRTDTVISTSVKIISISWFKKNSISNDSLKQYHFEVLEPNSSDLLGKYTDKLIFSYNSPHLSLYHLLSIPMIPEGNAYLRCYSDSGYQFKFSYFNKPCDSYTVGLNNIEVPKPVLILSNPNHGLFEIEFNDTHLKLIRIYDIMGKLVYSNYTSEQNTKIEIQDVKMGLYTILIESNNSISKHKIVIE